MDCCGLGDQGHLKALVLEACVVVLLEVLEPLTVLWAALMSLENFP